MFENAVFTRNPAGDYFDGLQYHKAWSISDSRTRVTLVLVSQSELANITCSLYEFLRNKINETECAYLKLDTFEDDFLPDSKLSACPHCYNTTFCVAILPISEKHTNESTRVECVTCGTCGPISVTEKQAAERWNALPRHCAPTAQKM